MDCRCPKLKQQQDVYKRQIVALASEEFMRLDLDYHFKISRRAAVHTAVAHTAAVSYTHLDVYKRQITHSVNCGSNTCC